MRLLLVLVIIFQAFGTIFGQQRQHFWQALHGARLPNAERHIVPKQHSTFSLDESALKALLSTAPSQENAARKQPLLIDFPMPNGSFQTLEVHASPIMHPDLAKRYPNINTYTASNKEANVFMRFDVTPKGLHAMAFTPQGTVFIDPYFKEQSGYYVAYFKRDYINEAKIAEFQCLVKNDFEDKSLTSEQFQQLTLARGGDAVSLHKYRLAVAATGEYTTFHGGTKELALAAIVTTLNRVNGIYHKDLAITMELVSTNDSIIYLSPSTDPFTEGNANTIINECQSVCDAKIGSANYDIGHVFGRSGGGGLAQVSGVCNAGKARAYTSNSSPQGDGFDVDYVAHEMGHQFGARHTFSYCGGAGDGPNTAYEPGSGSTIMAYAGICGSDNVQNFSDPYFHYVSINEISAFTRNGGGSSCAQITATTNTTPNVTVPSSGFSIPLRTPFELTGSATDAEDTNLSYCWEQYDLGTASSLGNVTGNSPAFRSFSPINSPTRIFPKIDLIITGDHLSTAFNKREVLPREARTLSFRLTVRDNNAQAGGVTSSIVQFSAAANSDMFRLTKPSSFGLTWKRNNQHEVAWNVANTNIAPVNCSHVDILLSTDGGQNFNTVLLSNTPNDGSEVVTIPDVLSTTARIKVKAVNNIFFDISGANFEIADTTPDTELEDSAIKISPNPAKNYLSISFVNSAIDLRGLKLRVLNLQGQEVSNSYNTVGNSLQIDTQALAKGIYIVQLNAPEWHYTAKVAVLGK